MTFSIPLASIRTGVGTLVTYPLRTILSTLGIIIGVASLVAVLALGDGVERFAREQIERTTSVQSVVVSPRTADVIDQQRFARSDFLRFTPADGDAVEQALQGIATSGLLMRGGALLRGVPGPQRGVEVIGATPGVARLLDMKFEAGRFFTSAEADADERVVVISHLLARDVAGDSGLLGAIVGDSIRLQDGVVRIIGVLDAPAGPDGRVAFVPLAIAQSLMAPSTVEHAPDLLVKARTVEGVAEVQRRVEAWLTTRDPRWRTRATIQNSGSRLKQAEEGILIFKITMGAITGITLVVGGIGIMNVLLASVVERTREIGVRKAMGARQSDILSQFLAEAVTVSGIGSVFGVFVGLGGAFGITALMRAKVEAPVYAAFSWSTIAVAALASVVVGLVFGL
ncbi:MAG: ABC transporter permease, partial [Gemmatimonadota bacterium]